MGLIIEKLTLGMLETNCYIVADKMSKSCVVIDPAWDGEEILKKISDNQWTLSEIWLTHAHFDHFGGLGKIMEIQPHIGLGLHSLDLDLYNDGGGSKNWGITIDNNHQPNIFFEKTQKLNIDSITIDVLFVPGHSPGHVAFFEPQSKILFGGDVLFKQGIGRTDLEGGNYNQLIDSIKQKFLVLPDETKVYPGHGLHTSISIEKTNNPFIF
tara:strand:+ start:2509 stop:3141 length:633 start_codon:yes stop_codon:yes gene_type:complete